MKIRQAKKLMLRTIDRMPKYWIGQIKKSNLTVGRGDHRLVDAMVRLERYCKRKSKNN